MQVCAEKQVMPISDYLSQSLVPYKNKKILSSFPEVDSIINGEPMFKEDSYPYLYLNAYVSRQTDSKETKYFKHHRCFVCGKEKYIPVGLEKENFRVCDCIDKYNLLLLHLERDHITYNYFYTFHKKNNVFLIKKWLGIGIFYLDKKEFRRFLILSEFAFFRLGEQNIYYYQLKKGKWTKKNDIAHFYTFQNLYKSLEKTIFAYDYNLKKLSTSSTHPFFEKIHEPSYIQSMRYFFDVFQGDKESCITSYVSLEDTEDFMFSSSYKKENKIPEVFFLKYIKYVFSFVQFPIIEKLFKAGLSFVGATMIKEARNNFMGYIFKEDARKLHKILQIPRYVFEDLLREEEVIRSLANPRTSLSDSLIGNFKNIHFFFRTLKEMNQQLTREEYAYLKEIRFFNSYQEISDFLFLLKETNFKIKDIISYLRKADMYQAMPPNETLGYYKDYIHMMKKMNLKFKKWPDSLYKEHALAMRQFNLYKHEHQKELFTNVVNSYRMYNFEKDDLLIRVAEKPEEVMKEGNALHHCVSSYIGRMLEGKTIIFFIREKSKPNESYYTLELRNNIITQVRGKFNAKPKDKKIVDFISEWASKFNFNLDVYALR